MAMHAWLHFFGGIDKEQIGSVPRRLAGAGIEVAGLNQAAPIGPGLVFFNALSPELLALVREINQRGTNRVLAIHTPELESRPPGMWALLEAGASDVVAWRDQPDPAIQIAARLERWAAVDELVDSHVVCRHLIGQSPAWRAVLRTVVEIARFTNASVLILGESGTGKELVSRLIHTLDARPVRGNLVVLDCTTIVPELSGSEFFGHERGAFTGATVPRDGAFALADRGTLFLDEVGELPQRLQAQLLRVIQERQFKRVGGNKWQATDFRLACATHRDLSGEVERGEFRADLYYRLATYVFRLPPLRERREDILPLAHHFLQEQRSDPSRMDLDEAVQRYLLTRDYPGNVRDLKQLMARIGHRHVGPGPITVGDIPEDERPAADGGPSPWPDASFEGAIRHALTLGYRLKDIGQAATETAIRLAVGDEEGNLQRAACRLGVTDRALQMRRANGRR